MTGSRKGSVADDVNPMCGKCERIIRKDNNDSMICCSLCLKDFHQVCSGISKATFTDICKKDSQVAWFCSSCNGAARNILKGMADLQEKYSKLEDRITAIESGGGTLPIANNGTVNDRAPSFDDMLERAIDEMQDQKNRENNLVCFGLRENGGDSGDGDREIVVELLQALGADQGSLLSSQRLGKPREDGSSRPVKIRMVNLESKKSALSKARDLRSTRNFSQVYVKPDLTVRQQRKQKVLVDALKAANQAGNRMKIVRGRLVPLGLQPPFAGARVPA